MSQRDVEGLVLVVLATIFALGVGIWAESGGAAMAAFPTFLVVGARLAR